MIIELLSCYLLSLYNDNHQYLKIIILLFICIIKLHVIPLKVESMLFSSNNYSSDLIKVFYKFIIIFLLYYIFLHMINL